MIGLITRLLARPEPVLSEAGSRDAAALSALHAVAFRRGWSEYEFERLLLETNVIAHRAMIGRALAGFIVSRLAAGEAEILSVAVAPARRGRGVARKLLDLHLRRMAGLGATVTLELPPATLSPKADGLANGDCAERRPIALPLPPSKPGREPQCRGRAWRQFTLA